MGYRMNALVDAAQFASFRDGKIVIVFENGMEVRFPVEKNPRLAKGNSKQLGNVEISPFGLHWPELDEDLSIQGIMKGDFGQARHNPR
jgi:hypothetical protein